MSSYNTNSARVVIGPLTTTFTPAPACTIALQETLSNTRGDQAYRVCSQSQLSKSLTGIR